MARIPVCAASWKTAAPGTCWRLPAATRSPPSASSAPLQGMGLPAEPAQELRDRLLCVVPTLDHPGAPCSIRDSSGARADPWEPPAEPSDHGCPLPHLSFPIPWPDSLISGKYFRAARGSRPPGNAPQRGASPGVPVGRGRQLVGGLREARRPADRVHWPAPGNRGSGPRPTIPAAT